MNIMMTLFQYIMINKVMEMLNKTNKKIYIIEIILIMIVSLSFGCIENKMGCIELKTIDVEKTDNLEYLIVYEDENGYIKSLDTKNIEYNNIFKLKINNENGYKLYFIPDMIIGGEYILYIPKTDIIA